MHVHRLKAETDLTAITILNVPNRCPDVSRLPGLATQDMSSVTNAPLTNPYASAKSRMRGMVVEW